MGIRARAAAHSQSFAKYIQCFRQNRSEKRGIQGRNSRRLLRGSGEPKKSFLSFAHGSIFVLTTLLLFQCGFPDPQADHAVRMVKFAQECSVVMKQVTEMLEARLGPGTAELGMRFGIHSGPITAGVLSGNHVARVQFFGDTMNTGTIHYQCDYETSILQSAHLMLLYVCSCKNGELRMGESHPHFDGHGKPLEESWQASVDRATTGEDHDQRERRTTNFLDQIKAHKEQWSSSSYFGRFDKGQGQHGDGDRVDL